MHKHNKSLIPTSFCHVTYKNKISLHNITYEKIYIKIYVHSKYTCRINYKKGGTINSTNYLITAGAVFF